MNLEILTTDCKPLSNMNSPVWAVQSVTCLSYWSSNVLFQTTAMAVTAWAVMNRRAHARRFARTHMHAHTHARTHTHTRTQKIYTQACVRKDTHTQTHKSKTMSMIVSGLLLHVRSEKAQRSKHVCAQKRRFM